jgi:hypothetical protein
LSFNNLDGEVTREGKIRNSSELSVMGNSRLCGVIPAFQLPACPVFQ